MHRHYRKGCRVPDNHPVFSHPALCANDSALSKLSIFVARYVSHLASSHETGVDADRLANLRSFLLPLVGRQ